MEVWKQVPIKFDRDIFFASSCGMVKRLSRKSVAKYCPDTKERIIIPQLSDKGYYRNGFNIGGKRKWIYRHRIIALTFVDNPENKPHINHKDGDKLNNHADNLEWCTPQENNEHGFQTGLLKRGRTHPKTYYVKKGYPEGKKPVKNTITGEVFPHAAIVFQKEGYKSLNYFWRQLRGERPNPTPYRYTNPQ